MVLGFILGLFRSKSDKKCLFCGVTSDNPAFTVVKEGADYVMFKDIRPAAVQHYLVVPKVHIDSVKSLSRDDVKMVKGMLHMGKGYFDECDIPVQNRQFGFHIPPLTLIQHLHLHCFALPFNSTFQRWFYHISVRAGKYFKGWSWFIEVNQAINVLERGGKIRLGPC